MDIPTYLLIGSPWKHQPAVLMVLEIFWSMVCQELAGFIASFCSLNIYLSIPTLEGL